MKSLYNIGDKINRLTIKGKTVCNTPSGRRRSHYICECECGNEVKVEGYNLNNGRYKSCGCLRSKVGGISNTKKYRMWKSARDRAIKKGLEFSIRVEDIKIPKTCPLLNKELIENDREYTPSLDRINSSKGYTIDNIWVISHRANQIKNDATLDELKLITENLSKII